jgi:capsular exopolysaccharide synthesis family protein
MSYRNGHSADEVPAISLRGLAAALRRQIWWITATTALGVALTVYVVLRQRPLYEARATLRMPEQQNAVAPGDVFAALNGPSTIETEMEILRSRTVAEAVVDSLGLRATVIAPRGAPRGDLFGRLVITGDARPGTYEVWRDTTVFSVTTPDGRTVGAPYGAALSVAGITVEPLPLGATAAGRGPARITLAVSPTTEAAEDLRQGLRVARPVANAGIVSVAYQSTDPELAAEVVNGVAQSYIQRRGSTEKQQDSAAVEFLGGQVQTIHAELSDAEQQLERYRRAHSVIDPQAQAGNQVQQQAALQVQQEELASQRSVLQDLIRRSRQPADSVTDWAAFMGSPVLAQNTNIAALLTQLVSLTQQRAQMLTFRTAADPQVVSFTNSISLVRSQLAAAAAGMLQGLSDQARTVDQSLAAANARLGRVPQVQLEYARLNRAVELNGQLYTLLQTKLKEAQISQASEIANVQLVDPAVVPTTPLGGRRMFNLLFGSGLALLCGGLVGLMRESSDTRVRSREEVVRLTDVPLLASIPRIALHNGLRNGLRRELAKQIENRLVLRHAPRSPAAEAYRALRTNVAFAGSGERPPLRTIVVTSPEPMDGKTTTAVNLAITMAEQGLRAVLIDGDQRRPVLHKVLHTDRVPGLSGLLNRTTPLEEAIRDIPLPHHTEGAFGFIPAGHVVPNPAELLGSGAMRELLVLLAARYDVVIMDTPPLCVVTDAAVLGTIVDGVILVARMGATHGEALHQAVSEMQGLGARVVGSVLTDVSQREDRYGSRHGYYTYYYDENGKDENGNGAPPRNRIKERQRSGQHARSG